MVLDDEKKKEIGKRIQKTRKKLGYKNGHDFYDFVFGDGEIKTDNKKDSVISEWENGKRYIDLDHLMLAADKLGVSLDYLVYGKGEEEHAPTFREICENVARFFFLAKAEIVQTNDCLEMKFYQRNISDYVFDDNCLLNEGDLYISDDINRFIWSFCVALSTARHIDNAEIAKYSGDSQASNLPLYRGFAAWYARVGGQKVRDMARKNIYIAPIVDRPYSEKANEYLESEINSIPFIRTIEDTKDFLNYLYELTKDLPSIEFELKEMEKAPPE